MQTKSKSKKQRRLAYASITSVLYIIAIHKEGRFTPPITPDKLETLDVPNWNKFVLYHALEDLALIRGGRPTATLDQLAQAYQTNLAEYQRILEELLRNIYSSVFNLISDPASATSEQFMVAFADFAFPKQHRKMISLFKGLCREAGLINDDVVSYVPDEDVADTSEVADEDDAQPPVARESDLPPILEGYTPMTESASFPNKNGSAPAQDDSEIDELLDAIVVLRRLSKSPGWTVANRGLLRKSIAANVDLLHALLHKEETK